MKIENSHVNMASNHNSYSYTHVESIKIERRASNDTLSAIMELSEEGEKSYKGAIEQLNKDEEEAKNKQEQQNMQKTLNSMINNIGKFNDGLSQWEFEDLQISIVKRILDVLNGKKMDSNLRNLLSNNRNGHLQANCNPTSFNADNIKFSVNGTAQNTLNLASTGIGRTQVWQKITATEGTHVEYENSTFASQGTVETSDGRSLNFNVEVTLGRNLSQKINTLSAETYTKILTDPLVINMDTNATSISDQKFKFDIDADGKEDEISFVGKGSGFLALDKNGDGIINDGSELFGTKSGDGFQDLAEYDEDGNGWIDENDSVFSKLKVWTKDENGNDKLLSLKEADVGAIYLNNVSTEFSYKDPLGDTNAVLRKTGIYLKESTGAASTVAHVDLAL